MRKEIELTDYEIECRFFGTNFGGSEKTNIGRRGLMSECVLKVASGYHDGHTITSICKDVGLINMYGQPMKSGIRWAFDQLYKSSSYTILERLQSTTED